MRFLSYCVAFLIAHLFGSQQGEYSFVLSFFLRGWWWREALVHIKKFIPQF